MGRPVLLALRVVGVHGITRIHGGQKQKDIKSDPNLRSHHQRFFLGADAYRLYVFPPFSVFTGSHTILFRTILYASPSNTVPARVLGALR